MDSVSFDCTDEERELADEIAQRARRMEIASGASPRRARKPVEIQMDIIATHANGNRLRLRELAAADDFNFAHDVFGIARHLNRETGELMDCFRPRYSVPAGRAAEAA